MRNVSDKRCRENQNTHFMFNNFFSENYPVYDIIPKNMVETEGPHMTSQHGAYALRAGLARLYARMRMHTTTRPGYTNACTHARTLKHAHTDKYVIFTAFPSNNGFVNAPQCYVIIHCLFCLFSLCTFPVLLSLTWSSSLLPLSLLYNTHNTNVYVPGGIQTRNSGKRPATGPRLTPRDHRELQDSNPQSHQASGQRPTLSTARPPGSKYHTIYGQQILRKFRSYTKIYQQL
jgi:hypothetical protein